MIVRNIKLSGIRYLRITYSLLLLVMFILPFFSDDAYSIIKNTTSHLGAQNSPNAWIMNITFILVGMSCIIEAFLRLKRLWFQRIVLCIFGLSFAFTGIFRHAPIIEGIPFDLMEDKLHSVFASIVGFSFTIFAISTAFIEKKTMLRALAVIAGVTATILSIMMSFLPPYSGIWQRMILVVSFCWLIFMLEGTNGLSNNRT